jgi:alpha-beta hydrolase superfamily lysophospholipase
MTIRQIIIRKVTKTQTISIAAALALFLCNPSFAGVERDEQGPLTKKLNLPIYQWLDPSLPTNAVIVAVHGMTLYSGLFDHSARYLAGNGYPVYAADLRGFGRWWHDGKKDIDFIQSEQDIITLAAALRSIYPHTSIFILGESLGGNVAIRIACQHPDAFDGVILSSAAIARKPFLTKHVVEEFPDEVAHPKKLRDITPYIDHFVSSNKTVTDAILNDPLVRKRISIWEAILAEKELAGAMDYARKMPVNVPVLVLQGGKDTNLKLPAAFKFCSKLKTQDLTMQRFPDQGHVLLETAESSPEVLEGISDWANTHKRTAEQAKLPGAVPATAESEQSNSAQVE